MFAGLVLSPTVTAPSPDLFLEHLVSNGLLDARKASRAISAAQSTSASIEKTLVELGLLEEDVLYPSLAEFLNVPFSELDAVDTGLSDALDLSFEFLQRVGLLPIAEEKGEVLLATADTNVGDVLKAIAFKIDMPVRAVLCKPSSLSTAFSRLAHNSPESTSEAPEELDLERLRKMANDGPVIRLVNDVLGKAASDGASDVHIEADEDGASVRFRVDGTLRWERRLNHADRAVVVSRLKVIANLNISEKRRPQDGRAGVTLRGRPIDLRLSTLPTQHGESVVIRLLDQRRLVLQWPALGYPDNRIAEIRSLLAQPNGIVLVAGPTGSGKTTTLYTALSELHAPERKLVTVEDPIEYSINGVNQVQVEPAIEMSFARALRAILRQDPDIVMVGEIRDEETAEIAVRAALVGRLVLSTVHTNDAVSAMARLVDLGVPPYLLSTTLRGVISQRLVRRLCKTCQGAGCVACNESGYAGRIVMSEVLRVTPDLAAAITSGADIATLRSTATTHGFQTLAEDGERLIQTGVVLREDVLRAVGGCGNVS